MKFALFQPTTQKPFWWRSLIITLILCFVLPAVSSAQLAKIAFESKRDGNWEIYVMDADGKNLVNLTKNGAKDLGAAWSPDGTKIAFVSTRDGNWAVHVMDADGNNPVNLTQNGATDRTPSWSPDRTKIAFWSNRDGNEEIYVMDADGNNPVRLTNNPADDDRPDWCCPVPFAVSPKGKLATTWGRIKGNF